MHFQPELWGGIATIGAMALWHLVCVEDALAIAHNRVKGIYGRTFFTCGNDSESDLATEAPVPLCVENIAK